jgi:hypothetical protein
MNDLVIGSLKIKFHRTVRVAADKVSNLPPSLGTMEIHHVKEYRKTCPAGWEDDGIFLALHDKEAMWMSFATSTPVALLIGAGGVNALTGEKLGTVLEKDNYLVTPPQPWLDGWKDKDGTVYQFVATEHKKGEGLTVGEQLIGKESKTGALGIAVFEPKDVRSLQHHHLPQEKWGYEETGAIKTSGLMKGFGFSTPRAICNAPMSDPGEAVLDFDGLSADREDVKEMGVGKGGKIHQKIYPDPHGIEVWKDKPISALAVYLIGAEQFAKITGKPLPTPVSVESYQGHWFGLEDKNLGDVQGTDKFTGLKSAFAGETSNVSK